MSKIIKSKITKGLSLSSLRWKDRWKERKRDGKICPVNSNFPTQRLLP